MRECLHMTDNSNEIDNVCKWFLLCENPATTTIDHPILGRVEACVRCVKLSEDIDQARALAGKAGGD